MNRSENTACKFILIGFLFIAGSQSTSLFAQDYRYGLYANPLISWFKTDIGEVRNEGTRPGFMLCFTIDRQLTDNWHFNAGLAITSSSARLKSSVPSTFRLQSYTAVIAAGDPVVYKLKYLSLPVGIKIRTSEKNNLSYFAESGLDPKVIIRGIADIPSIGVKGENAMSEIRRFNAGYHLNGGIEYFFNGDLSVILGLGYESNILDITKDVDGSKTDYTSQKFLRLIFGLNF